MRWSKLFIPTLRDDPSEAESLSHRFLLRAGYIRALDSGSYSNLPLAQRSLRKIMAIMRQEMNRMGAQEIMLPALHPGMTHEEVITATARAGLRSYKQLPQIWYQVQTKFREEPRSKLGITRVHQFLMKESFSLDLTSQGRDAACDKHREAYGRIFQRCGLDVLALDAHFMVASDAGEDLVVVCPNAGMRQNWRRLLHRLSRLHSPIPKATWTARSFPRRAARQSRISPNSPACPKHPKSRVW